MTVAQIVTGKNLYRRFRNLRDEDAKLVLQYIDDLEGHEPNAETIAAFKEAENLDNLTSYATPEEMFRDFGIKC